MADAEAPSGSHGSTVFVSNLPYTATSVDLQTLFSDVGPVRSAFIVQDKETKVSKGVGYVSFAIREDAERAVTDTYDMDGRTLRVQWPSQKNKDAEGAAEKPKKQPRAPKSSSSPTKPKTHDPKAIRTIVISGLPPDVTSKVLWKKVRKQAGAEEVTEPVDGVANAVFGTLAQASDAVAHLHAHVFKGALLSVALKKRLDGLLTKKGGAPSRASRLIVRNLPFDITEAELRATFLPYGPIYSVDIPLAAAPAPEDASSSSAPAPKGKGFAFVWYMSKADAEKALAGANGKPLATPGNAKGKAKEKAKEGRIVAVDWALSKNRWEAEKAKIEDAMDVDEDGSDASSSGSGSASDSGSESGSGNDDDGEEGLGVHDSGSDASDAESDDSDDDASDLEDDDDAPKERAQLPQTDVGTTVFIRNVPYDASDDDLRTLFRAFGPLRYARVTMDHESGRSRGTGFACFWKKEDADAVLEHARVMREELGLDAAAAPGQRKNPFAMPTSLLTPDPSASLARSLVLHGRTLDVTRAVTRDQAGKLKDAGERAREKQDKRNLYLMREGVIFPATPAAAALSPAELEKRQASYNARRALLRSNPSLYVSKTRLSVRQLPPWVSERVLKRLALHAVRAFEADVKAGIREGLAEDELHPPAGAEEDQDVRAELETKKGKGRGKEKGPVLQAKVVRQPERLDALSGKGRSRGYGFLQMAGHAHALRVLRWANNNPAAEPLMRAWHRDELADMLKKLPANDTSDEGKARRARIQAALDSTPAADEKDKPAKGKGALILEFSIENVQVVRKRREKQESQTQEEKPSGKKRSLMDSATATDDAPGGRDRKKRRTSTGTAAGERKPKVEKADSPAKSKADTPSEKTSKNNLGSLIGRKRKERKAKRG